jgi:hypothetical protein
LLSIVMLMSGAMTNPDTSLLGTAEGLVGSLASLTAVPGTGGGGGGGGQQKDTTWTKLFVGGLPYHTTDKSLRDHFAVYGDIEEAVVITDRQSGKSRGYGFVSIQLLHDIFITQYTIYNDNNTER